MKKNLKCLIVDDEPPARALIAEFISRVPYLQSVGECNNAINTLEAIHQTKPDILFLDINMPQMSGIELVKVLNNNCPQVIFTTAYANFALLGFDLNVTDYLLKPIRFDRFLQAVSKIYDRNQVDVMKSNSTLVEDLDGKKQYDFDSFLDKYDLKREQKSVIIELFYKRQRERGREFKRVLSIPFLMCLLLVIIPPFFIPNFLQNIGWLSSDVGWLTKILVGIISAGVLFFVAKTFFIKFIIHTIRKKNI